MTTEIISSQESPDHHERKWPDQGGIQVTTPRIGIAMLYQQSRLGQASN